MIPICYKGGNFGHIRTLSDEVWLRANKALIFSKCKGMFKFSYQQANFIYIESW